MNSEKCLYLSVLLCLVIIGMMISGTTAPAVKPKGRSGGAAQEFQLSCTVLLNGAPQGGAGDAGGDTGGDDVAARKGKKGKKGRKKRSVRVKRNDASTKVQLLCDIENKEGADIAMRSIRKKGKKAKKG